MSFNLLKLLRFLWLYWITIDLYSDIVTKLDASSNVTQNLTQISKQLDRKSINLQTISLVNCFLHPIILIESNFYFMFIQS